MKTGRDKEYGRLYDAAARDKCREYMAEYKRTHPCSECGESHPACLDFHHRNPNTKTDDVSRLASKGSLTKLTHEIGKCKVLCANCHRKHHHDQRAIEKTLTDKASIEVARAFNNWPVEEVTINTL